jgi:hypothetical protein
MDVFRKHYRQLTPGQVEAVTHIKEKAQELYDLLEHYLPHVTDPRNVAVGKTQLEIAVAMMVKGYT